MRYSSGVGGPAPHPDNYHCSGLPERPKSLGQNFLSSSSSGGSLSGVVGPGLLLGGTGMRVTLGTGGGNGKKGGGQILMPIMGSLK